jgi:NAD(P)H-dependent FMN reductase
MADRPLQIPVLRGTIRKGARSAAVARWVAARLAEYPDVATQLVELESLGFPADDEGTGIKNPGFSNLIDRSDGLVIVSPEYNHGYPASLKHALDTNYTEYVHKPVGLVGVSTGVLGGARMIENLLPVLRAVGLVPIQRDATVGGVANAFDEAGAIRDEGTRRRIDGMLTELLWMATTLRYGRESVTAPSERRPAEAGCTACGLATNHHADVIDEEVGGLVSRIRTCKSCGRSASEPA